MEKIECADCGLQTADRLRKTSGVHSAQFNVRTAEIEIRYDARVLTTSAMLRTVDSLGVTASLGAGKGSYQKSELFPPHADVANINRPGQWVDVTLHLVPGKVTVIDFHADWCLPCKKVDEAMAVLMSTEPALAYRRIDVGPWDSEVVRRSLDKPPELPLVLIFNRSGQQIHRFAGLDLPVLRQAIRDAVRAHP